MKKYLVLLLVVLMAIVMVVPVSAADTTANLFIGRDAAVLAGTVDVTYNAGEGTVTVTYSVDPAANDGWSLSEAHVYADLVEPTKSAPGKFPYVAVPTENPNIWTCTAPVAAEFGTPIYIAAHAALTKTVETPNPIDGEPPIINILEETGWAKVDTENFPIPPGNNWATYFILLPATPELE